MSQQTVNVPSGAAVACSALLEHTPPKLTLAAQVERLEFQAAQLNEMLGETIATVLVNLDRGNIRTCDQEAEKNLRAFLVSRSKWREQLMCSNEKVSV